MEPEIYDALADLKLAIDRQNELQEEANGIMRGLNEALRMAAQELIELREHLEEKPA